MLPIRKKKSIPVKTNKSIYINSRGGIPYKDFTPPIKADIEISACGMVVLTFNDQKIVLSRADANEMANSYLQLESAWRDNYISCVEEKLSGLEDKINGLTLNKTDKEE